MWWIAVVMAAPTVLEADVDRLLAVPALNGASVSLLVMDMERRALVDHQADARRVPASVAKIMSTAAAMEALGPDHTVVTSLMAQGSVTGGVLDGALVVVGAGDPTLGGGDSGAWLRSWAIAVADAGIERVDGDIIADGRVFAGPPLGRGWAWDDAPWSYSAPVTGLQIGHNVAVVRIAGMADGSVDVDPGEWSECLDIDNRLMVDDPGVVGGLRAYRPPSSTVLVLDGAVAAGSERTLRVTLPDPAHCMASRFRLALEEAGVQVNGDSRSTRPADTGWHGTVLATVTSPSLVELLPAILQDSDNLVAESVVRWLDPAPTGKTMAVAEDALADVLSPSGIARGWTRYDQLSASTLADVMRWAYTRPWGPAWVEALAVAGESGTLRGRMSGGAGRIQGKTGSMSGVLSLVVFVPSESGPLVYVMLSNGIMGSRSEVRAAQDAIAERLLAYSSRDDRRCGRRCQRRREK
jgi:D-alanyl-D-alanine carboxypeptidase/D-alanyl-D-alanine-endopeptidase (penicillin-binding protein 4)